MSARSGGHDVRLMTLNVYFGTDLEPAFTTTDLPALVAADARIWAEVQASDIPGRATRIAHEIAAAKPDLVALQEVVRWSSGTPGAMTVKYDFLELILEALGREGTFYIPIAIRGDLDQMAPIDMAGNFVRIEDRHAFLLNVDPPHANLRPYDIMAQTFQTILEIQNPVTGPLRGLRSWIALDALVGNTRIRFVASHVESLDHEIQLAQTRELIEGPTNTSMPVILMGDLNSNGNRDPRAPDFTPAYPAMIAAGFKDAWAAVNPGDFGNTCCHAADLRNPAPTLDRRLDLILTRGSITPISAELILADPVVRTPSGVWPSDHAGVLATLRIG